MFKHAYANRPKKTSETPEKGSKVDKNYNILSKRLITEKLATGQKITSPESNQYDYINGEEDFTVPVERKRGSELSDVMTSVKNTREKIAKINKIKAENIEKERETAIINKYKESLKTTGETSNSPDEKGSKNSVM